jgi:hypothetical protein
VSPNAPLLRSSSMISRTRRACAYSSKVRTKIREYSSRRSSVDPLVSSSNMMSRQEGYFAAGLRSLARGASCLASLRRCWVNDRPRSSC